MCYLPGTNALIVGVPQAMAYLTPSLSLLVPDAASSCPCTQHPSSRQLARNQPGWGLLRDSSPHSLTKHSESLPSPPFRSAHGKVSDGASLPATDGDAVYPKIGVCLQIPQLGGSGVKSSNYKFIPRFL